jgi:hypothetical protein
MLDPGRCPALAWARPEKASVKYLGQAATCIRPAMHYDRGIKMPRYAAAGAAFAWLLDPTSSVFSRLGSAAHPHR